MPSSVAEAIDIGMTPLHNTPVRENRVGALVIGGEHPGLGVARSLGRKGIPVVVLDDQHSVSSFSRYVTRVVRTKNLRDARSTVDAVLDVGHRLGLEGWVLFPTRDETVAAVARYRSELKDFFRLTTPEWEVVRWTGNKKNTYDLAVQLGVPTPRTWNPRSEAELSELHVQLPLAIKPAVKENFFYATGAKAWRANTGEELHRLYAKAGRYISPEEIIVQEIIPGEGRQQFSYCAFFRDGAAHSSVTALRRRQHPREFGRAATYVESVEQPEIEELSERLLRAIDYYGLVEIEFKQDPRDGLYKLLDINARTWGFHSLGSAAGVDFPYLLFADQIGMPTEPHRGKAGIGWLRLVTDVPTVLSDLLYGKLKIRSYLMSLKRTHVESVFSREDPLPSLGELLLLPYSITKKYFL
ncbi:MAG: ATP-grasp domain-containing protein [Terriglobales bacterium]